MLNIKIKPEWVLLKELGDTQQTSGSIITAEISSPFFAEVVDFESTEINDYRFLEHIEHLVVGDTVIFNQLEAMAFKFETVKYYMVEIKDILAIINLDGENNE